MNQNRTGKIGLNHILDVSRSYRVHNAGFLQVPFFSTNKTDRHNITEILLKVALNTITQIPQNTNRL
jgi:hypothetical protein